MQEPNQNLTHVIRKDKVFEKIRDLIYVRIGSCLVQALLRNVPRYFIRWGSPHQQLEHDGAYGVNITKLRDLLGLHMLLEYEEFLDLVSVLLNFAIFVHSYVSQLVADFQLLRRYVVFISRPCVIQREVVCEVWIIIFKNVLREPATVVQVQETHFASAVNLVGWPSG